MKTTQVFFKDTKNVDLNNEIEQTMINLFDEDYVSTTSVLDIIIVTFDYVECTLDLVEVENTIADEFKIEIAFNSI